MSNPSKRKGSDFERRVVEYVRARGFPAAERRAQEGARDRGDVAGVPRVVVEVKNCRAIKLAEWMDEAVAEAAHDGGSLPVLVVNRRHHGIERSYFIVELRDGLELLRRVGASD